MHLQPLAHVFCIGQIEYTKCVLEPVMSRTTTMTVRLNPTLSEYVHDLIRRDMERKAQQAFDRLKAELAHAFAAPESAYRPVTAADVIARNAAGT